MEHSFKPKKKKKIKKVLTFILVPALGIIYYYIMLNVLFFVGIGTLVNIGYAEDRAYIGKYSKEIKETFNYKANVRVIYPWPYPVYNCELNLKPSKGKMPDSDIYFRDVCGIIALIHENLLTDDKSLLNAVSEYTIKVTCPQVNDTVYFQYLPRDASFSLSTNIFCHDYFPAGEIDIEGLTLSIDAGEFTNEQLQELREKLPEYENAGFDVEVPFFGFSTKETLSISPSA